MQLPGYKVERLIAEGGMASVYLAVQESLDRYVALKLLKRFDNPTQTVRFFNEGRIIASLNHRNVITIHDIGVVDERPYIAMEYLQGGDLKQRIFDGMSVGDALDLLETMGNCLDFVHRKGIIHRDIKPENILFREDGTPILTDFGIAKQREVDSSLTLEGMALGSPYYLSPEQAGCKALDGRADLYSLGIIFYEMITGNKPYRGDSPIDIILAHMTSPIPMLPPGPRGYQCLLDRMIAKDRDERFDCARTLVEYVRSLRNSGPVGTAAERLFGLLKGIRASAPLKTHRDYADRPIPRWRLPFSHENGETGALLFHKLWDNLSAISKPSRIASAWVLAALLVTGSMYGFQPIGAGQTPPQPVAEQTVVLPEGSEPVDSSEEPWTVIQDEIGDYLNLADAALKDYRLTTPARDNAYYYYRRILDLEPFHPAARRGLGAIGDAYANLASAALDRYEYKKAKLYLHRGLSIQPDNKRLLALEHRTNSVRDVGRRFFGKIKSLFD